MYRENIVLNESKIVKENSMLSQIENGTTRKPRRTTIQLDIIHDIVKQRMGAQQESSHHLQHLIHGIPIVKMITNTVQTMTMEVIMVDTEVVAGAEEEDVGEEEEGVEVVGLCQGMVNNRTMKRQQISIQKLIFQP